MISKVFLFLIVPSCVFSYITIDIRASKHYLNSKIECEGNATGAVGPREEQLFQITQDNLRSAIDIVVGKRPDQIFLREPTPWNLYSVYDWSEVKWVSRPIEARLTTIVVDPVVLKKDTMHNSKGTSAWDVNFVPRDLKNNVSMTWDNNGRTDSFSDMSYNVIMNGDFISQVQGWSSWGVDDQLSGTFGVDPYFFRRVVLQPGETLEALLLANRVSVEFEVRFEVQLKGKVAVNYSQRHRGHHFWAIDIQTLQAEQHLPKTVHVKETITVEFFTDGRITFETRTPNEYGDSLLPRM